MATQFKRTSSDMEGHTRIKHELIPMHDGVKLCADVFLPFSASKAGEKVPVICSLGPYGKDVHASSFGLPQIHIYAEMYKHIKPLGPDACSELCEPLVWCQGYGYAILRVDERGIGNSEEQLDPFGLERSFKIQADAEGLGYHLFSVYKHLKELIYPLDLYDAVEWAAAQSWSNGKVAFSGISYYGMVGYWAAMQKPPHLTCVMSYESACSLYQAGRRGGIYSHNFQSHWYSNIVIPQQRGARDGSRTKEELEADRADYPGLLATNEYLDKGCVGNWTDSEVHLPGNIRAFNGVSSKEKWFEMHTGNHLGAFYEADHISMQRKFLDYFLFDKKNNGMLDVPRIRLLQHHGTKTLYREAETSFPTSNAQDVSFYLTPAKRLSLNNSAGEKQRLSYYGYRENITFTLESPFAESFEILGSPYLELEVSTSADDLDLFIYLRAIDENGKTVVLKGNHGEPMDSFARGYFRLSHRDKVAKVFDKDRVIAQPPTPKSKVVPGQIYRVVVPMYPAAYLFDKGQTLLIEIGSVNTPSTIHPMRHEGGDRVAERFEGKNIIISHGRLVLPRVRR